jgi:CDP-diacylglycerol--serine O-phosphatidyltransferase
MSASPNAGRPQKHRRTREDRLEVRERRRLRLRRRGRRAYIRSVYFLPSMATLGNAICGFGAMYVAVHHEFSLGAYLIFLAMVFDALDGRLARFARHTTDFGGQLDSLADVISFGTAPAFLALLLLMFSYAGDAEKVPLILTRFSFGIGALFMSCAALRLARFNVSNEHGEQHHFSFLGLPSPAAGGTVAAWILLQQWLVDQIQTPGWSPRFQSLLSGLSSACIIALPVVVLGTGLLMISQIRYPHLVNRYLRGRRSIGRLIFVLIGLLALAVAHQLVMAVGMVAYVLWGVCSSASRHWRMRKPAGPAGR